MMFCGQSEYEYIYKDVVPILEQCSITITLEKPSIQNPKDNHIPYKNICHPH